MLIMKMADVVHIGGPCRGAPSSVAGGTRGPSSWGPLVYWNIVKGKNSEKGR